MNPTDDELLAVLREVQPDREMPENDPPTLRFLALVLRGVVTSETRDVAVRLLTCTSAFADREEHKLARALRSRFPRPITDAVLRAEGFEPDEDGVRRLSLLRRSVWADVAEDAKGPYVFVDWSAASNKQEDCELVRTPDRLNDVMTALRTLYVPGEDA